MIIYCTTDNIHFRFNNEGLYVIDYSLYALDMIRYYENQRRILKILFVKGLITYSDQLEYLIFAGENLPEDS